MQFPFAIHSVTNLMCHVRDTLARTTRKGKHLGNRNQHSGSRVPQEWLLVLSHWILCLLEGIAVVFLLLSHCLNRSNSELWHCGVLLSLRVCWAVFPCELLKVSFQYPVDG